jgi:sigma-E factor negative regulatory protein RseC
MGELGNVISKNKNRVTVALMRKEACSKCRACSAGLDSKTMEIECLNLCNAQINDTVEIVLEADSFFKAVSVMYGIPFIAFVLGLLGSYFIFDAIGIPNKELYSFLIGALLVAVSYIVIRSLENLWKKGNFVPKAIKIHN